MSGLSFFLTVLGLGLASEIYVRVRCVRCWWRIRRDGEVVCRRCYNRLPAPREVLDPWPGEREIQALFRAAGCRGEVQR